MSASKFTPEKAHAFLCVLADTCNVTKAAEAISVSRHTVYDWRDADPEFAKQWERAAQIGAHAVEDIMTERATEGWDEPLAFQGELTGDVVRKYSDTLMIFFLKGNLPDKYKDRVASEVSGPGGKPIEVDDKTAAAEVAAIITAAKARDVDDLF